MAKSVTRPGLDVFQQGGAIMVGSGPTFTEDGTITDPGTQTVIGQQPDGTIGVVTTNAAPPAAPSTPIVAPSSLGLVVTWDGLLGGDTTGDALNANTDFEDGIEPWDDGNGVLAQSDTQAHGGTFSGEMTPAGDPFTEASIHSEQIPVTGGATYKVSGWFWLTTAVTGAFTLSVDWYDGDGAFLSTSSNATSLAAVTWEQVSNTLTAPADAVTAVVVPTVSAGSGGSGELTTSDVFYSDDITFAQVVLNTLADFDHVAVHVSDTSGFTPGPDTLKGTLRTAGNFPVTPLDSDTEYFVKLVGVSTSGAAGEASSEASGIPDAVVATEILDGIVTTLKLADDAVTAAKIAAGAVGTAQLGDESVDLSKLADGSVDASKLVDGAVGTDQLAADAVTAAQLADGSVSASALVAGAVGADALASNAVTSTKINNGAVSSGKLGANAVIAGKVAADAIGADQLIANSVIAGKIAADAVTADTVAAGAIGTNELAANSVVAGKIAADAVDTEQLVAGSVQTEQIAAGAVAADQIAAAAVTTDKLEALAVTAAKIAANAITAGKIDAGAVTADALAATLVLASQIIAGAEAGARVQLDDQGIAAYNEQGDNTVQIRSDGSAQFSGSSVAANTVSAGTLAISPGGALIMQGTGGSPLNANPTFATGTTPWSAGGSGMLISYSSTHTYNGHNTLLLSTTTAKTSAYVVSEDFTVTAGTAHTCTVISYNPGDHGNQYCEIVWLDSSGNVLDRSVGTSNSVRNEFVTVTASGVSPSGTSKARIRINSTSWGQPLTGQFLYVGYADLKQLDTFTSLATAAGTDDLGHSYPAGLSTSNVAAPNVPTNFKIGLINATTDANGLIVVPHGAGFTPDIVLVQEQGLSSTANAWTSTQVESISSNNFNMRCHGTSGNRLDTQAVTGYFICFKS